MTGVDDNIADGNKTYTIVTAPAISSDSRYSGLNAPDVAVTNTDNETIWCGLAKGLDKLENIVNDQLNAFKLPILGRLSDISPNFISHFKNSLVNTVKNATNFTPSQLENSFQEVVGSEFDVKVESSSTSNDSNLVIKIGKKYQLYNITFAEDLGVPALGLKIENPPKPTSNQFVAFAPTANLSRFANLSNDLEASSINFNISNSATLAPVTDSSSNVSQFSAIGSQRSLISPVLAGILNPPQKSADEKEPFTITNVDGTFNLDLSLPDFDKNNSGEIEPDEGRLVVISFPVASE